jgi:hypothetical protein
VEEAMPYHGEAAFLAVVKNGEDWLDVRLIIGRKQFAEAALIRVLIDHNGLVE